MINKIKKTVFTGVLASAVIMCCSNNAHATMYVEASYSPLLQSTFDFNLEAQGGTGMNSSTVSLSSSDFDMNWAGAHIGAGMNFMEGIRVGVVAEFYGNTDLSTPMNISILGTSTRGSAALNIDSVYDVTYDGTPKVSSSNLLSSGVSSTNTLGTSTGQISTLTLESVQSLFLGVNVGYQMMFNNIIPYIDVAVGMDQITTTFIGIDDVDGWAFAAQGRIGVGYNFNGIIPYASYAFRAVFEHTLDGEFSPTTYDVYAIPSNAVTTSGNIASGVSVLGNGNGKIPNSELNITYSGLVGSLPATSNASMITGTVTSSGTGSYDLAGKTATVTGPTASTTESVTLPMSYNFSDVDYYQKNVASSSSTQTYKAKVTTNYQNIFELGIRMEF